MAISETGLNRAFIVYGSDDKSGDVINLGSKNTVDALTGIDELPEGQLQLKIDKDGREYFFDIAVEKDKDGYDQYVARLPASEDAFKATDVKRLVAQGVVQNQVDWTGKGVPVQVVVDGGTAEPAADPCGNGPLVVYGTEDQLSIDDNGDHIHIGTKAEVEALTNIESLPDGKLVLRITKEALDADSLPILDDEGKPVMRDYFFDVSLENGEYVASIPTTEEAFRNEDVGRLVAQGQIQNMTDWGADSEGRNVPVQVVVNGHIS